MKTGRVYLLHIRDSIAKVESYATVGKETFMTISHWQPSLKIQLERVLVNLS
jgi:hypothetical protein